MSKNIPVGCQTNCTDECTKECCKKIKIIDARAFKNQQINSLVTTTVGKRDNEYFIIINTQKVISFEDYKKGTDDEKQFIFVRKFWFGVYIKQQMNIRFDSFMYLADIVKDVIIKDLKN